MSTYVDPQRSIAEWLETEAPDRAPARLIVASREQIKTTRQRPAWWPARRTTDMNAFAKLAIAAAAVVVVAIVGYNLLPGRSTGVGGLPASPSPSISASPSASASPSTSPLPSDSRQGGQPPARHVHLLRDRRPARERPVHRARRLVMGKRVRDPVEGRLGARDRGRLLVGQGGAGLHRPVPVGSSPARSADRADGARADRSAGRAADPERIHADRASRRQARMARINGRAGWSS